MGGSSGTLVRRGPLIGGRGQGTAFDLSICFVVLGTKPGPFLCMLDMCSTTELHTLPDVGAVLTL